MKVLDFPLKFSLNLFKPVLNKPSLSRLSLAKPSLNQVSACHLKTSFSKTRFNLKPGLFLGDLLPCLCIRPIMYKKYLTFLKKLFTFHKSELHLSIVRAVKEELDKSFDMITAIRNVLRKRKMEITDFVDTGEESSREDSDNKGTDDNI